MRQDPRLTRLTELADLIRDQRLEALRQANLRRQATEALIAGLEAPPAQDIPPWSPRGPNWPIRSGPNGAGRIWRANWPRTSRPAAWHRPRPSWPLAGHRFWGG